MSAIYKDGKWYGSGGTIIEQAVIIQQNDLTKFIEKYEIIKYIQNNRVVYTAGDGSIICGGYLWHPRTNMSPLPIDYSKVITPSGDIYELALQQVSYNVSSNKMCYQPMIILPDGTTLSTMQSYGDYGWFLYWSNIYPPDDTHPYGYVRGSLIFCYTTATGIISSSSSGTSITMDFLSEAEYNAALGLTYDYKVNEDDLINAGDVS